MGNPNIPVGISDFKEIRENNNYYIDKSGFISELLTIFHKARDFLKFQALRIISDSHFEH